MKNKSLPTLNQHQARLGRGALSAALFSIIFAELYALFAAGARTPGVYQWLPGKDFFQVALVTHVNLALVVWFLLFIGMLALVSVVLGDSESPKWNSVGKAGILLSSFGMLLMVLAPFLGSHNPVMSNYIPVMNHPLFFTALILVFSGSALMLSYPFLAEAQKNSLQLHKEFSLGLKLSGMTFGLALICFLLAFLKLEGPPNTNYFENLFWGGGHLLQFVNTLAMVSCWILLAEYVYGESLLPPLMTKFLLISVLLAAFPGPLFYLLYPVYSQDLREGFTFLMRWGLGLSTITLGLRVLWLGIRKAEGLSWKNPVYTSLMFSVLLFAYGGLIGALIDNSDVKIPAHYHGVIGAVTLAFMGASYQLLPVLRRKLEFGRWISWQPLFCGSGGLLFVTGMFWAGSHGVARKVHGTMQGLDNLGKIAGMTLMGLGGLITVFGLLIYVAVMIKSLRKETESLGVSYDSSHHSRIEGVS